MDSLYIFQFKMSKISYSKIVFGLKHHQYIYDCQEVVELVRSLRIIISEHDDSTDVCERPGTHYHGIIEHGRRMYVNNHNVIAHLKIFCEYFILENCDNPEQYVAELVQPPKKIMIMEISKSFKLKYYYKAAIVVGYRIGRSDFEKEFSKMEAIKYIISDVSTRRTFDKAKIQQQISEYYDFSQNEAEILSTCSVDLLHQKMLDQSILVLCGRCMEMPGNYYNAKESADFVVEWCNFHNIDVEEFTMNLVKCFDKQVWNKNTLYFQGSSESGIINIINSVAEACPAIGKIDCETTGYCYVWEDCVEKRCIIMRDPIFDGKMFEELENVMKGVGTLVPHRQSVLKYLRPTPVIVICCENSNDVYLRRLQSNFLVSYSNLKPFVKLINDPRRLHPDWLNVLYMYFTGNEIGYTESFCEDSVEGLMDSESPCELKEEIAPNSPVESASSATNIAGCLSSPLVLQDD